MGLNPYAHFTGWIIYFLVNGLYVSLVFIFPLKFLGVFDHIVTSFGSMLGLYFLYMLASFFFVLFLSTFFNDAKIAAQGTTFIQILTTLLYFLTFVQDYCKSSALLNLSSIFPPLAYDFSIISIGLVTTLYPLNYTFKTGLIALGATAVGYFILFLYFEQTIPHEFGTPKHPLFFIRWMWAK